MSNRLEALDGVRRFAAADRLSHAYLITGPAGAGKQEVAAALAGALVCTGVDKPCGACSHCKKAAAGIHPDVIMLTPEDGKRDILVDQVRRLRADVYIRPNEAPRKVYCISPAGAMNPSAQNALLKVLEDGPAYAAFLLLSETAGALLPTIRSRCEELSLTPDSATPGIPVGAEGAALAKALLWEREGELMARCVALEKLDRESLLALLEQTMEALEWEIRRDPACRRAATKKLDQMKALRAAGEFNLGVGHLAGWLCAGNF